MIDCAISACTHKLPLRTYAQYGGKKLCVGTGRAQIKGKGSPYSITESMVPAELIPVLGSQLPDDVSHKPGGRLPLLSARPAVTPATFKRAATNFSAW